MKRETVTFPERWRRRSSGQAGDLPLARQLNRLLIGAGAMLMLLIVGQMAALGANRFITARLVNQRMTAMSELQTITASYQTSWTYADKVRVGTIDASGGAAAIRDVRARLDAEWAQLGRSAPQIAAEVAQARPDADAAIARLQALLEARDQDRLDFFLSGQFYGAVDPLLGAIGQATEALRVTADGDRQILRWVNFAAEVILVIASLAALAGGILVTRRADRGLVRPLVAIADHVRRRQTGAGAEDEVPGMARLDEIGAIAQALAAAQIAAHQAEAVRGEQRSIEERLRQREQAEARAMQTRAHAVDAHFARFDSVLSQLVTALSQASEGMRAMATTLASASTQAHDNADIIAQNIAAAARRVDMVRQDSQGLLELVTDVRQSAATTRAHSMDVIDQSGRNRAQAQSLTDLVEGIAKALDLIRRIAAQTNLLSVNANIEAHRSGAAGLGFAVVAREIKVLAVDSGEAAGEIAQQLDRIGRTAADFLRSAALVEELATGVGQQADSVEALTGSQQRAAGA